MSNEIPPTPATAFRVSWFSRILLLSLPFILIGLAYGVPSALIKNWNEREQQQLAQAHVESVPANGAKLYEQNCAYCHGIRGDGNGIAPLTVRARFFGHEKYKFGSTDANSPTPTNNSMPTDDNLKHLVKRGIPGSAMPSFSQLNDDELDAVVKHVRSFTRTGVYSRLYIDAKRKYDEGDDEPNPAKISERLNTLTQVGKQIPIPEKFPEANDVALANGKRIFTQVCANCHGAEGKGDGQQVKDPKFVNDDGTRAMPRDLTKGILKGGDDLAHIYTRIMLGIPGTPMPSSAAAVPPKDLLDLVVYVKSLSQPKPTAEVASK